MRICTSLFALIVGTIVMAPANAQVILEKVAEVGDPAPDTAAGIVFEDFGTHLRVEELLGESAASRPRIDRRGNVSLHAFVGNDGIPDDDFFTAGHQYRAVNGSLERIAGAGDPAPGLDASFTFFPSIFPESARIHDSRLTFLGTFEGNDSGNKVFTDRFGNLVPTVGSGDSLPGMFPGASIGNLFTFISSETIFYSLRIDNAGVSDRDPIGFWRDRGGDIELIGATGVQAPGFPAGIVFGQADNQRYGPLTGIDVDDRGRIALTGAVRGTGIERENDEAVWIEAENGLEILVREGDRVPGEGFPRKSVFESGSISEGAFAGPNSPQIRINNTGEVLFSAQVNPGKNAARIPSLWTTRGGSLVNLLRGSSVFVAGSVPGSPAPGIPGGTFTAFTTADINDRGDIVVNGFAVDDATSFTEGIWIDRDEAGFEVVAIVGNPVPDNPGSTFASFGASVLEEDGSVIYTGSFSATSGFETGLFQLAPDGSARLLVRTGGRVEIVGSSRAAVRFVEDVRLGFGTSLSGEKVAEVLFEDGTAGIYTMNLLNTQPSSDTTSPAIPATPFAVDDNGAVVLDWSDNFETDLKQYRVERSVSGGPQETVGVAVASEFRDETAPTGVSNTYSVAAEDVAGNVSDSSFGVSITPGVAQQSVVHVSNISVDLINGGFRGNRRARARVTVVDASGVPVAGALVSGEFRSSGFLGFDEDVSAITGTNGVVEFITNGTSKVNLNFEFCVTAVGGDSIVYAPADNVVTCLSN